MTGAHEAGLANELKLPFGMICIVDNMAHGVGHELTVRQVTSQTFGQSD